MVFVLEIEDEKTHFNDFEALGNQQEEAELGSCLEELSVDDDDDASPYFIQSSGLELKVSQGLDCLLQYCHSLSGDKSVSFSPITRHF